MTMARRYDLSVAGDPAATADSKWLAKDQSAPEVVRVGGTGSGKFFDRLSNRFRDRRNVDLRRLIARVRQQCPRGVRLLDLGGTFEYWQRLGLDFLAAHDVRITCVNSSAGELSGISGRHPLIRAEIGDGRSLTSYANGSFDLVHSNSVIEHVGLFADMRAFANEVRRLAPAHYIQTPYVWFPIDPHFPRIPGYHWLPMPLRLKLMRRYKLGWAGPTPEIDGAMRRLEYVSLLDASQFTELFPDSTCRFERLLGLPKSLIAERLPY